ncbi:YxeA family protein, partial [Pseudomonas aeruginosa]
EVYEFSADKALRENAYLKLYVKEKGVSSYDEVKLKDIPEKVQLKLK